MTNAARAPKGLVGAGTRKLNRHFKRLSPVEARRALYIDFEGEKGEPPVLLGVHRRGKGATPFLHQDILDQTFGVMGLGWLSLHDAIEKVVRRAEKRDRRIVAWSEHELGIVRGAFVDDPDLAERFMRRFANARALAERWRNRCHDGRKPPSARLADYLVLIEYDVPGDAGPGQVGATIRQLRKRLERGLRPTPAQRRRWANLVEHNRHDCAGMRRVCLLAAQELDLL